MHAYLSWWLFFDIFTVNRHFGETNMNVRSSRSHTIFRMVSLKLFICDTYVSQKTFPHKITPKWFVEMKYAGDWKQRKGF